MSTTPLRPPLSPIARRVRAYFAPVDRNSSIPAIFDPALDAGFPLDAPPAPWLDVGWIENFRRSPGTEVLPVRAGAKGTTASQFRARLEARVEFDFLDWGKLQMALAGGSEHFNVLDPDPNAPRTPSGAKGIPAVALQPGSTATEIIVGSGAVAAFAPGDVIVVDLDYVNQTGYVGAAIAGAFVRNPADVSGDVDFIRRASFNLGKVASTTATSLLLVQPLLGGTPPVNAKVQKVIAFVDREAGSFFQEWSALFILPAESGGRVCFHYPFLQPAASARETSFTVAGPLESFALHAAFTARPLGDPIDAERVLCYRTFYPPPAAPLY
ncbi:MAG TPA: hypothetical protein VNK82_11055 [Terriglobales bacterium]|nr:hypothetical protein [Terriglobales bacterium]